MRITIATPASLADIVGLNKVVQDIHVENEPALFRPFDEAAVREFIRDALEDPAVTFLLAQDDGMPVGYAMLRSCDRADSPFSRGRRFLELEHVAVAPEARLRGEGSALMDEAFALAKSLNIDRVELSVWEFNENAQRLFHHKGLKPCWRRMSIDVL